MLFLPIIVKFWALSKKLLKNRNSILKKISSLIKIFSQSYAKNGKINGQLDKVTLNFSNIIISNYIN